MRILLAEDEAGLARGLQYLLEKNRFSVDVVYRGDDALDYFHSGEYDAVILDIMMPGKDGLEVLTQIRKEGSAVPIMMLTALGEVEDRVLGLEKGADDYLPKPFATREFLARVRALTRRSTAGYAEDVLTFCDLSLDRNRYELRVGETVTRLNNKEFQLMELLMLHPRHVFSTEHLMDRIWGMDSESNIEVVWTYVGMLRKKMKALRCGAEIRTVRGAGYSLEELLC